MANKFLSVLVLCFLIAMIPMLSALPTVTLGPSAGASSVLSGATVLINQTGNFTTNIYNITNVINYTNNYTYNFTYNITNNITINNSYYVNITNNFSYYTNGTYNATYNTWLYNWTAYNKYWYNMSDGSYNVSYDGCLNNASYLSTYNLSYNGALNNASYLSTYNLTYDNGVNTWLLNFTAYAKYWYNMTVDPTWIANFTAYSKFWYNSSVPDQAYTDSKLITVFYNVTSIQVVTGTSEGGLDEMNVYDERSYNVTEVGSDMDLRVNFTGITEFNQLIIRYKTDAAETHTMTLYLWNYVDGAWESYNTIGVAPNYNVITMAVYDYTEHVSGGLVQARFYTNNVGALTHKHQFDWITISKGPATPSSGETDPVYTVDKALYSQYWYNMTYSGATYNVSYDGSLNNASYLSIYNVSYHNDINTWLANFTAYSKFWYNHTSAVEALYGKWFYNMSDGSYNATYNTWAYNQTSVAVSVAQNYTKDHIDDHPSYNLTYEGTYNITYDNAVTGLNANFSTFVTTFNATYEQNRLSWDANFTTYNKYWYNMTYSGATYNATYEGYNTSYGKFWYNMTYSGATFNLTYDTWLPNYTASNKYWYNMTLPDATWVLNFSAYSKYWYNHTSAVEALYGKWFYNQSTGTTTQMNNFTALNNEFAANVSIDKSANFGGTSYIRWDGTRLVIGVS